jgi:hypothetical protein
METCKDNFQEISRGPMDVLPYTLPAGTSGNYEKPQDSWCPTQHSNRAPKVNLSLSLINEDEWSASRPGRSAAEERANGTHWIEGWVGPRAGWTMLREKSYPAGNQTPAVQLVVRRFPDSYTEHLPNKKSIALPLNNLLSAIHENRTCS